MSFDPKKAERFAERFMGTLNAGAICLMTSIGHRTGLFDAMAEMAPATSDGIAQKARLDERYVREWLGAMVTGQIVDYDPGNGAYSLPAEHAAFLTRKSTPDNMAVFAQYIPLLGSVEDDIVDCFQQGGGVPYSRYPRFHQVMAEDSGQTVLSSLFEHILPLVPGLTERLHQGIHVLDVGCGSGRATNLMASQFPNSRFWGYDLSDEAIHTARQESIRNNLTNTFFEAKDLSTFDQYTEHTQFDFITAFDAIHDQAQPRALLKGISQALKPEGIFLMQDIHGSSDVHQNKDHPIGPFLYTISCLHCMTVSLAQDGEGLGAMWGREKAQELLSEAGFNQVDIHTLAHDIQNDYYIIRK